MAEEPPRPRPAYYAAAPGSPWRDWWTLLHPPYTLWHLSYVVMGACLVAHPALAPLLATLAAFFLGVGVAAHAFDELQGRPLGTSIPRRVLFWAGGAALLGAASLGAIGVGRVGPVLLPFIVLGVFLVICYNAELFGGRFHTDAVFALGWGAFPVLTSYVAQAKTLRPAALLAAAAACALSSAQRSLSTRARLLRRAALSVEGAVQLKDGRQLAVDEAFLLGPLERALQALSWCAIALAAALAVDRMA